MSKAIFATSLLLLLLSCNDESSSTGNSEDSSSAKTDQTSKWPTFFGKVKVDTFLNAEVFQQNYYLADSLQKRLMDSLPAITIRGKKWWILEQDIRLSEVDLFYYCQNKLAMLSPKNRTAIANQNYAALTIAVDELSRIKEKWAKDTIITYSVNEGSFSSTANYQKVVAFMKKATEEWMDACDVQFKYMPEFDSHEDNADLLRQVKFVVQEQRVSPYVATAFYPLDPPKERRIYLDPLLYYGSQYDPLGTLRHELGHVLGFRHESIWSRDALCRGEEVILDRLGGRLDGILIRNTYDSKSVMHYKCGASGSYLLEISPTDKSSAAAVYGPPRQR